jgi:DNA modification methylase
MKNIYFKNSQKMSNVKSESVDLIITSPPYFNIKDYAKNGSEFKSKICLL